jgi:hypothetical protein
MARGSSFTIGRRDLWRMEFCDLARFAAWLGMPLPKCAGKPAMTHPARACMQCWLDLVEKVARVLEANG